MKKSRGAGGEWNEEFYEDFLGKKLPALRLQNNVIVIYHCHEYECETFPFISALSHINAPDKQPQGSSLEGRQGTLFPLGDPPCNLF